MVYIIKPGICKVCSRKLLKIHVPSNLSHNQQATTFGLAQQVALSFSCHINTHFFQSTNLLKQS